MAMTDSSSATSSLLETIITGSHILHNHGVLDAYGHLSVRHPEKKDIFLMPRNMAPALLSTGSDIVEYWVEDASPVYASSPDGYVERFIHSEIYRRYPTINSVIHSHAATILPFSITGVDLRPCMHMSGFLGKHVPKFDIAQFYSEEDVRDLLIRNQRLGRHLSSCFAQEPNGSHHPVVLMRGHGFTVVGESVPESVFRAIYTVENAQIQSASLTLQLAARTTSAAPVDKMYYLNDSELDATTQMTQWSIMRPWNLWVREVEANPLYTNNA